jgi:hypothetical protein
MDLPKFLSVLDRAALYFPRIDKLAEADPFEGYQTNAEAGIDKLKFEDLPPGWLATTPFNTPELFRKFIDLRQVMRDFAARNRESTFVNSWHAQEYESAAMWSLYLKSRDGIAIQSTYNRLIQSMTSYTDFFVFVGLIHYIDYDREFIPQGNLLFPFMHKRKSFEHEKELRALIWTPQHGKNDLTDPSKNKFKDTPGLYVPVDIKALIQAVFVAPTADRWFADLVSSLTRRFDLNLTVVKSRLTDLPS